MKKRPTPKLLVQAERVIMQMESARRHAEAELKAANRRLTRLAANEPDDEWEAYEVAYNTKYLTSFVESMTEDLENLARTTSAMHDNLNWMKVISERLANLTARPSRPMGLCPEADGEHLCLNPAIKAGMCNKHYMRRYRAANQKRRPAT